MLRRPFRRILTSFSAVLVAVALVGCGDSRTPVPGPEVPAAPVGVQRVSLDGLVLSLPGNWTLTRQTGALAVTDTSGSAVIALWGRARASAAPAGAAALDAARTALVAAVRRREPSVRILSTSVGRVAGESAISLDAIERIGGQLRRVRSVHLLRDGSELVLEEYAPLPVFASIDRRVFSSVVDTLRPTTP